MVIVRNWKAQNSNQQKLSRRRLQQIGATHDLRDLHRRIVNHNRQLVRRDIIAAPDDEVTEVTPRDQPLWSEAQVIEANLLTVPDAKAPVNPGGRVRCRRWHRLRAAGGGVQRFIVPLVRCASSQRNIPARARARINCTQVKQLLPSLQIPATSLALNVRPEWTSPVRSFVPLDAEPAHILDHRLRVIEPAALRVQVFVAKNESPALFFRPPCCNPEGARMSDMQQPSG